MTTNTHERPEWRDYPELIITNDPAVPEHIEDWLQRRYRGASAEAALVLNHEHARRAHIAHLATDAAPGPPIRDLGRGARVAIWALERLPGAIVIGGAALLTWAVLRAVAP